MKRSGFTLAEMLVVIGIVVVLGVILMLSAPGEKASVGAVSATQQIATLLREAQSRTFSGDENGGTTSGFWGVEIVNATNTSPFYTLFFATSTASVASSTVAPVNGNNMLPSLVTFSTSSVPSGGTLYIYYSSGTVPPGQAIGAYAVCVGFTCPATTTISLSLYEFRSSPPVSTTLIVAPTGAVSF